MTVVLVPNRACRRPRGPRSWPTSSSTAWPTSTRTRSIVDRPPAMDRRPARTCASRARPSVPGGGRSATGLADRPSSILVRAYLRVRLAGRSGSRPDPAIYCFNHLSWADPFILMATLPYRPRLWFFGPKEEDMGVGGRNRVMTWTGTAIPYKPGKNDLLEATRRVGAVHRQRRVSWRSPAKAGSTSGERAPAAERGRGLFRDALGRSARPGRHQRARAGCGSAGGCRVQVGEPIVRRGPAEAGGARRRDRAAHGRPWPRWSPTRPRCRRRAGSVAG